MRDILLPGSLLYQQLKIGYIVKRGEMDYNNQQHGSYLLIRFDFAENYATK